VQVIYLLWKSPKVQW